jgi:hypothetical protein
MTKKKPKKKKKYFQQMAQMGLDCGVFSPKDVLGLH